MSADQPLEQRSGSAALTVHPVVRAIALFKYFHVKGNSAAGGVLKAVDGVDLTIASAETVGLIGESGSGKSTLGRMLLRLLPTDSGRIDFDGIDITGLGQAEMRPLRARMNLVFQNPHSAVNRRWRIADIIAEPLASLTNLSKSERQERVGELMDIVGLPARMLTRYPHELSGGQLQRVVIARAVATRPDFIVADEPTASLDMSVRAQVINLLDELKARYDLSVLFISHDLRTVSHVSDRIAVMYLGRIVELGAAAEVEREPLHPYTVNLIAALPKLDGAPRTSGVGSGELPSALNLPSGCRYSSRCPLATEVCHTKDPILEQKRPGRYVACHHVVATV